MNNIDIANGMVFQKMMIGKETFEERLICQKKIYLLQSLGTDLGYSYNWYVRGPYAPALTNYVYNNIDVLSSNDFSSYKLSKAAEENVNKVNELVEGKPSDMTVASWYELLASLLYIDNNKESWKIDNQEKSLFKKLMKFKPQYNEEQCKNALGIMKRNAFMKVGA